MTKSENINELAKALSLAQGEIQNASKNAKNPHFKSTYADLGSVLEECRKALSKQDLSFVQTTDHHGDHIFLVTTLMHTSGQWLESSLPLLISKEDMQGLGSAITYARRYSIAALCGIAQEDDDGNKASQTIPHYDTDFEKPITKAKPEPVKNHAPKPTENSNLQKTCHHDWVASQYKNKTTGANQVYCPKCRSQKDVEPSETDLPF